jgi:hypothetical protein
MRGPGDAEAADQTTRSLARVVIPTQGELLQAPARVHQHLSLQGFLH